MARDKLFKDFHYKQATVLSFQVFRLPKLKVFLFGLFVVPSTPNENLRLNNYSKEFEFQIFSVEHIELDVYNFETI